MAGYRNALDYHALGRPGKVEVVPTKPLLTQRDLSMAYTPGVAEPCRAIARDPDEAYHYTNKGNLVAVVTNGTAVLGLGAIGPLAGKPVMEGKANLFKKFADIDVFDIEMSVEDPEAFIAAVKAIAPTFGGINLEDIRAPECFTIESRLKEELDIPVFHDDQHGTSIIAGSALLNACQITQRETRDIRVVFCGAGAAAIATARLFTQLGVPQDAITMFDVEGIIHQGREALFAEVMDFAQPASRAEESLADALVDADVFVGLSVGGVLKGEMLKSMRPRPIIFAMANPEPEIPYAEAKAAVPDAIVATGRSDYPNQINNVLGFPFVFRGALDCRAKQINQEMKIAAVQALADLAREDVPDSVLKAYNTDSLSFGADYLIPKPFDPRVLTRVAPAVAAAAQRSGVARQPIADLQFYAERLERRIEHSKEFLRPLMNRARLSPQRIVFPEGAHPRVLRAAQILVDEGICRPILLGERGEIQGLADGLHLDLKGMEVVDPGGADRDQLAHKLWQSRERKGMTYQRARRLLGDATWCGCMMVREGLADGLVGGIELPYADTLSPALQTVGKAPKVRCVSGVYTMIFKDRVLFFGDCTVNVDPSAKELAQIAINTARVAQALGVTPRVAMLSYSDFGEHRNHDQVRKVIESLRYIRAVWPDLMVDGELQADTAVNEGLARDLFPFSPLQGESNVLIFPDLASGNIAYKLLRELGGATALGPLLVGLAHPVNALPIGCTVDEIVYIAALTANQALGAG